MRSDAAILADSRWCGRHGIGRFASEVLLRMGTYEAVPGGVPLLSPLDSVRVSFLLRRRKPSVYFTPGFNPPLYAKCPVVFVIHDLIHLHFAAESTVPKRVYYEAVVKRAARQAAFVLTVSESSRAEIIEWAKIPAERVRVVGNGVSDSFSATGPRYAADKPYLLFVGNRKPHKNLPRILEAFAHSSLVPEADLYVNGSEDPGTVRLIEELHIRPSVRFAGSVSDSELAALYRGALGLVTPSLYEGFGLPAIEAAACGCPVIAGNLGAQAEVMDGAALLVDPVRVDEISNAMRALTDADVRARTVSRGLERASMFTWDKTGASVAAALNEAMQVR